MFMFFLLGTPLASYCCRHIDFSSLVCSERVSNLSATSCLFFKLPWGCDCDGRGWDVFHVFLLLKVLLFLVFSLLFLTPLYSIVCSAHPCAETETWNMTLIDVIQVLWGLDGSGETPPRRGQHHVRSLVIRPERVDRQCPLVSFVFFGGSPFFVTVPLRI